MKTVYLFNLINRDGGDAYCKTLYENKEDAIELVWRMVEESGIDKAQIMFSDMEEPITLKSKDMLISMVNEVDSQASICLDISIIVLTNNDTDMCMEITPLPIH